MEFASNPNHQVETGTLQWRVIHSPTCRRVGLFKNKGESVTMTLLPLLQSGLAVSVG
jgi:hypothetical protein